MSDALEDDFTWVIRKALRGHSLAPADAARRADLPEPAVLAFTRGTFSETVARGLAGVLGLNTGALAGHPDHRPAALPLAEIHRLDLPFGGERVNAWLIAHGGVSLLFDTGDDPDSCLAEIDRRALARPDLVLITHDHRDHVGGVNRFEKAGTPPRGPGTRQPLEVGQELACGPLTIQACDLSGHATPSLGYHVHGLGRPVLVTGDAIFAGSMGGCNSPSLYQHALHRLHDVLSPLPDETTLLPGHGPATTLGEERRGNPFL